ncbi:MAG: FAD-dependent oxidoreductase [Proteobacteria bacterium]|nr:FAD-dependent oxidoreductase [Pseudomonadota bacterium]
MTSIKSIKEIKQDREKRTADFNCDVLVIGGGGSGLAAAIEAADNGAHVILLEKNPELGGTTAWSIGSFTATQTTQQLAEGIEDSPDEHFADMPKFSGPLADRDNPALRRLFVDNANETLRWLEGLGVEFLGPMPEPPHTKPRMHNVLPNSKAYIRQLGQQAHKIGVDVRVGTRATRFLLDGDRVTGVICDIGDGAEHNIRARAVVLASGDYAANPELKARFISPAVAKVDAMNPTATGDGHVMAFPLGAHVLNGDVLSGPTLRFVPPPAESLDRKLPPTRLMAKLMRFALKYFPDRLLRPFVLGFTTTSMAPELDLFAKGALLINKEGLRITGAPPSLGLSIADHPDKIGYVIVDQALADIFSAWPNFISTAPGVSYAYFNDFRRTRPDIFHKGGSLMELAEALAIDAKTLSASVTAHNSEAAASLSKPPFYALGPAKSYVVLTDGGLAVSDGLQVLGENDKPIPGLYAAGSAGQGGLMLKGHGHHIGWAFTSGRLVGRIAAAEAASQTVVDQVGEAVIQAAG